VPRYAILEHDHPALHWDLMLEASEVLRTWRLAEPPQSGRAVAAEPSFDHRRMYLDYEGPVSGGRGTVTAWDRGTFEAEPWPAGEGVSRVAITFHGGRLNGPAALERASGGWWLRIEGGTSGRTDCQFVQRGPDGLEIRPTKGGAGD
jgi:hypothetical protein